MDKHVQMRFLNAVKDHKLIIEHDDGVHRCIYLGKPGTGYYSYRLVTWPGYLAISGDLDDFTFCRLTDMFDFFRYAGPEYEESDYPNYGYWSEKAQAVYKHGGLRAFDENLYEESIKSDFESHIEFMTEAEKSEAREHAEDEELFASPCNIRGAISQAMDWQCPVTNDYPFNEFYEHRLEDYSFGFKFACHAIQWGIKQYDLAKQGRDQASHDALVLKGVQ